MKKNIFFSVLIGIMAVGCNNSPQEKIDQAKDEVTKAKLELSQAQLDARNENFKAWQKFRNDAEKRIGENEKSIDNYRDSLFKTKSKINKEEVETLEEKNRELRRRIEEYEDGDEKKWEEFKIRFNNDAAELRRSIENLSYRKIY